MTISFFEHQLLASSSFWSILEYFGFFWELRDSFGVIRNIFESFGFFRNFFESFGILWNLLKSFKSCNKVILELKLVISCLRALLSRDANHSEITFFSII